MHLSSLYKFKCTLANASLSSPSTGHPTTTSPVAVLSDIKSDKVKFGNQFYILHLEFQCLARYGYDI